MAQQQEGYRNFLRDFAETALRAHVRAYLTACDVPVCEPQRQSAHDAEYDALQAHVAPFCAEDDNA